MDSRPHGARRATDDAGDVFVSHLLEKAEYEHFTLFPGEFIEGRMDALGILGGELLGAAILGWVDNALLSSQRIQYPVLLAQLTVDMVSDNTVDPCGKSGDMSQVGHISVDVEPHVLEYVLGCL
jgi:hypothetical protein